MIPELLVAVLLACDPALTALFTPARPQWGRYQVCTTPAALEAVMTADRMGAPNYGAVQLADPLDAFGTAGPYDRSKLARAYGGKRARVVRGWSEHDGVFETTTLISPYPDATLTHLMGGTLVIRLTLDRREASRPSQPPP